MKTLIRGIALGVFVSAGLWMLLPKVDAQAQQAPCSVDGAKYPELIPEYFVWEFFFRSRVASAVPGGDMSLAKASAALLDPQGVRNIATQDLGIPEEDTKIFLEVGLRAVQKADALRAAVSADAGQSVLRQHQLDAAEVILDGRDELARRLSPSSFQALRRRLPRRGTTFDFPPA